jgi:hypothetical protein
MRSLLLVESFDLRPSNQHILVMVIPSCFRFGKMYLCQVSVFSLEELHIVYMDRGGGGVAEEMVYKKKVSLQHAIEAFKVIGH